MTKRDFAVITAADSSYFFSLVSLLESLLTSHNSEKNVYIYDLGLKRWQQKFLDETLPSNFVRINLPRDEEIFPGWNDPKTKDHYAWKPVAIVQSAKNHCGFFWIDAGVIITAKLSSLEELINKEGVLLVKNENYINLNWTSKSCAKNMNVSQRELEAPQIMGNFFAISLSHPVGKKLLKEWSDWCRLESVVKGDRSSHRHDQTVLSILASRMECKLVQDKGFTNLARFRKDKKRMSIQGVVYLAHRRWIYLNPRTLLKGQYKSLLLYLTRSLPEILRIQRLRLIYRGRGTFAGEIYVILRNSISSLKSAIETFFSERAKKWKR
jgi:hypothetical protein